MRNSWLTLIFLCGCDGLIAAPTGTTATGEPAVPAPVERLDCTSARHPASTSLRRLTRRQYERAVAAVFDGQVAPSAQFPAGGALSDSVTGYSTEPALNAVGDQAAEQLMLAAEDVAVAVAAQLPALLPCAAASPGDACAGAFADRYARRAFRRPPDAGERAALLAAYRDARAAGFAFDEGIAAMTVLMLQSPRFLYAAEAAAGAERALDGWELASRLSFLFWDSVPDDALLDAAASGALETSEGLTAEAMRLLASPNADPAIARLFREWLQAGELAPSQKDQALFPQVTFAATRSLNASLERFAAEQVRQGTLVSLLTSDVAYVDAESAPFFGVAAPPPGEWRRQALGAGPRLGLVTQPAVMGALAHSNDASYVLRGRMVHKRLLCQPLGAPPAAAMAALAELPLPANPTGKDVSQVVQARGAGCAGCHRLLDPPGLALEVFDAIGRHRTQYESGKPIDGSGVLGGGGEAIAFADHRELLAALARDPRLGSCFAQQVLRFAMSRLDGADDACALQAMSDGLEASGGRLDAALLALVASDSFRFRKD